MMSLTWSFGQGNGGWLRSIVAENAAENVAENVTENVA